MNKDYLGTKRNSIVGRLISVLLPISLIGFFVFPSMVSASTLESQLPREDAKKLLGFIQKELANTWTLFDYESREQVATIFVRDAIVQNELSFWTGYLSKELLMTIPRAVSPLISSEEVKIVIKAIELAENLDKATVALEEWLTKEHIKVEAGVLDRETGLWYILTFYPLDDGYGEVSTVFYSPRINNFESSTFTRGSFASGAVIKPWGGSLEPFKLEIRGKVKKIDILISRMYLWEEILEGPTVSFSKSIPEFPIGKVEYQKEPRAPEKKESLLQKLGNTAISFLSKFKNALSQLNPFKSKELFKPEKSEKTEPLEETPILTKKESYQRITLTAPTYDKTGEETGYQKISLSYSEDIWELERGATFEGFEGEKSLIQKNLRECSIGLGSGQWPDWADPEIKQTLSPDVKIELVELNGNKYERVFKTGMAACVPGDNESIEEMAERCKENVQVSYYFPLGTFFVGEKGEYLNYYGFIFPTFTNKEDYQRCAGDFEEVLKTLERE